MTERTTFVKLDRNIQRWRWYTNANVLRVFIHLLLNASISEREYESIQIGRGEVAITYDSLASSLRLSIQQIRTAINHLKSTGEITIKKYPKCQVISIVGYYRYQGYLTLDLTGNQQADNTQITLNQQANNRQITGNQQHNKNIKNNKNINNNIYTRAKENRHKYGEYKNVLLSDADMDKLKTEFPADYQERIERLSAYMESTGKSYKNHLATIRNWARKDKKNDNKSERKSGNIFYDLLEDE